MSDSLEDRYQRYKTAVAGRPLPLGLVDLEAFEANLAAWVAIVRGANKTLRLATKSIRSVALIRRALELGGPTLKGLMCFSAREVASLAEQGFDDLLLAYPTALRSDAAILGRLAAEGRDVKVVVDDVAQLDVLVAAGSMEGPISVVIEVDLSLRPMGTHLGVRRSPLHSAEQVVELAEQIRARPSLRFTGVMGYEAQIAGLTDANPFTPLFNPMKKLIKRFSRPSVLSARKAVAEALVAKGFAIDLFNGGGTGSLTFSAGDPSLTELTAGSGLLDSHLFDYYDGLQLRPAACFAVQVVRRPAPDIVTCHGGGFVASGEAGPDRLPVPYLPPGLTLLPLEGAGEVQTPLRGNIAGLGLGAPVFFRHAKAGELAEHVSEYLLVRGDNVEGTAPTYRGEGHTFL